MKEVFNELCDYEFIRKVKIEESKDKEEMPTMVIDEDQDSDDVKTEEKVEDVFKPIVSYEISDEEEISKVALSLNWKIRLTKKILISDLSNYKCHKIWLTKVTKFST